MSRRVRPVAAVVLAAAVLAAGVLIGCGSGAASPEPEPTDQTTIAESARPTTGLGRLEAGYGPAGLLLDVLGRLDSEDNPLGTDWVPYVQPKDPVESCRFGEPLAETLRSWANLSTSEGIGLSISVYEDEAAARAATVEASGPAYGDCLDDSLASFRELLAESGFTTPFTIDLADQPVRSILGDDGLTWWATQNLGRGVGQTTIETAITITTVGRLVVATEVGLLPDNDQHEQWTRALLELVDTDGAVAGPEPDDSPGHHVQLNAAVERLRAAVRASGAPNEFYRLSESAILRRGQVGPCSGSPAPVASLLGPSWATENGISGVKQIGSTYLDTAQAENSLARLETVDLACRAEQWIPAFFGSMRFIDGSIEIVERDGRRFLVEQLNLEQTLEGAPSADAQVITVLTTVDSEIVGWRFLGLAGDEPDLIDLTIESIDRMDRFQPEAGDPADDGQGGS
jgi:hypothetical protein